MKNNIEITTKNTVMEALASYLSIRKAYDNYEQALKACYIYQDEIIDTLGYLSNEGEPNATTMLDCYLANM